MALRDKIPTVRAPGYADDEPEYMSNVRSITAIPMEQCPWPEVRAALIARARSGEDIYAYRPAHQPEYVIWHRQAEPWMEARFKPRAWAIRYGYLSADEATTDGKEA
jgi:hypothetical protein